MKKFVITFLLIFLFSCEDFSMNSENINNLQKQKSENCMQNSPLKNNNNPKIYWTFQNSNDEQCYYLGYIDGFFLITPETLLAPYAWQNTNNEINSHETIWKEMNFSLFYGEINGNRLYWHNFFDGLEKLQKDIGEEFHHEVPLGHWYYHDTLEHFLQKFWEYQIVLPEYATKYMSPDFWENFHISILEDSKIWEIDTTTGIDIYNLYEILRNEQQKSLWK